MYMKNKQHLYNDTQTGQQETAVEGRILVSKKSTSLQTMTWRLKQHTGCQRAYQSCWPASQSQAQQRRKLT